MLVPRLRELEIRSRNLESFLVDSQLPAVTVSQLLKRGRLLPLYQISLLAAFISTFHRPRGEKVNLQ